MKTNILTAAFAAALALGVVSCNKLGNTAVPVSEEESYSLLNIQLGGPATKVGGQTVTNESKLQNIQIFVFRAGSGGDAGNLEISSSKGFDTPLNVDPPYTADPIKCSTGEREIWVVLNDSEDRTQGANAVSTKEQFLALTHDLQNSASSKLLMLGSRTETLQEGTANLTINVKRYAASVVLESVKNDFLSPAYQKSDCFRLENAYLLNVPGRINFGHTSDPASYDFAYWYAKRAPETDGAKKALTYEALGGVMLAYNYTHSEKHTFYTYPNASALSTATAGDFTARATVLVLEASIKNSAGNWQLYYYPVALADEPLESNKQYKVNLIIHRPGSLDPNVPVTFSDVTSTIQVEPWDKGTSYSPEV